MHEKGNLVVAAELAARLRQYRQKNPYYWYALALKSYRRGKYSSAAEFAQDAIAIEGADHRFHFLLGMARYQLGSGNYRRNFRQAMELAGSDDNLRQYQRKMERLGEDIAPENTAQQVRVRHNPNWWWYISH
ncbi:tetratricopeptide repeat protein [Microbulbifer donghaiensis]|uniref:hypothetical protein n=1 Tax=Microbulbifer donghaiensis TaxID=494016 RepID=UPI00093303E0|nr:hypothetical protein [Microbulbifer donghaiensis]